MRNRWRCASTATLVALLTGCGPDPGSVTLSDRTSLDELGDRGASVEERRTLLSERGYACSDASGSFARADGSVSSAPHYVFCQKNLRESLICTYHVQVMIVPHEPTGIDTHFTQGEVCL